MPQVRILTDIAGPDSLWESGQVVEMTTAEASVWADGVRGEVVRPVIPVETPERNTKLRRGGYHTPETRQ